MDPSPQRLERRGIRYPLQLPVSLRLAQKELHARSENISHGGILLSSAFLIPEGSSVEVAVGAAHLPQPSAPVNVRGKVLRVQPKASGDFSVAIAFERPIELSLQGLNSGSHGKGTEKGLERQGEDPRLPQGKNRIVSCRRLQRASAWHMET